MNDDEDFRFRPVRDGVLLADLPGVSEERANEACVALAERLRASRVRGLLDAVPGACSLLLIFDPLRVCAERVRREAESANRRSLETIWTSTTAARSRRLLRLPVAYGGEDLDELARGAGLSREAFAARHCAAEYRVAFLGFAPGFAYLRGLPSELAAARLDRPRPRVPAGSVAIGGAYTGVYPASSPGGWRLIGRTTVRLFDPDGEPPTLWRAGDRVRFESVRPEQLPAPPSAVRRAAADSSNPPLFRVLSPGVAATIQGAPEDGLRAFGIPPGGAMDAQALAQANARVGNPAGEPALEMALVGPELEAMQACVVALAGAALEAWINGKPASPSVAWTLSPGDRLRLGRLSGSGAFAYLAVAGGLLPAARYAPRPRLAAGDTVARGDARRAAAAEASSRFEVETSGEIRLRTRPGPEADHFAPSERERFYRDAWRVSLESDRRGTRLEGAALAHRGAPEIPPSGTVPGSVQVPGGGQPIILGPDGPVTGGYPRIATVLAADLPLLGRAVAGTVLRFSEAPSGDVQDTQIASGSTMRLL